MTARTSPVFTLTPGPAGAAPATLAALSQPILHHQDPAFLALYAETVELLRRAFGTADAPVIFPGEAGRLPARPGDRADGAGPGAAPPGRGGGYRRRRRGRARSRSSWPAQFIRNSGSKAGQNGIIRIVIGRHPHDYQKVRDLGLAP
jgi:hypothetical protein